MNWYFLFEGQRTEPRVYRSWLKAVFPQMSEVKSLSDLNGNEYFMRSGNGYPAYLDRVEEAVTDIERSTKVDHLFICVDAEDDGPRVRSAIQKRVNGKLSKAACHIVIAECCIETWFLGNHLMMPATPQRDLLAEFRAYYDVSVNCPEAMGHWRKYERTRAMFHKRYLKELLRENGHAYSETNPRAVKEPEYLTALATRHDNTSHLQSFGQLLTVWRSLEGQI